jgi:hypothetical protein
MFYVGDNEHQVGIGPLRCPLDCFANVDAYDPTF